ncbi:MULTISPECIES: NepR family anti-sigma factor [Alphaproteobacteria]|uniref:Anti-sigma factor NepR domain-containing protein n=2 Tax=Alphaproteobacteria TaxID=28211 RepID=A0A512HL73_9HYPH|nr:MULTISPECIES: NepR family anti-sigma factor [Alphaproteobacteria]GEO86198.1 hypothetical protein RNA01_31300 [Ciceribacter naphthalenivorans]GLR21424.1 hypothetical protein GCM10007920_12100 [Ciceribacter naphthalenivorans]GLT04280.1 hypothetical protein GCM10007926_12100 [Sphingomonas psychrolutea]
MTHSQKDPAGEDRQDKAGVSAGITSQLRRLYQSVQDEAIPDRFLSLLEKLDQAEKRAEQTTRPKDSAQ